MNSKLFRHGRQLTLIFAAGLAGGLLVGPVVSTQGTATAATTYTRYASCAASDFLPEDYATTYGMDGTMRTRPDSSAGSGNFRCNPGLPNGAVVKSVRFTLFDGSSSGEIGPCSLRRMGLTTTTALTEQTMASVAKTDLYGYPGTVRPADNTISYATVDLNKFAYWMECWQTAGSPFLGILGADLTFTITAAKG